MKPTSWTPGAMRPLTFLTLVLCPFLFGFDGGPEFTKGLFAVWGTIAVVLAVAIALLVWRSVGALLVARLILLCGGLAGAFGSAWVIAEWSAAADDTVLAVRGWLQGVDVRGFVEAALPHAYGVFAVSVVMLVGGVATFVLAVEANEDRPDLGGRLSDAWHESVVGQALDKLFERFLPAYCFALIVTVGAVGLDLSQIDAMAPWLRGTLLSFHGLALLGLTVFASETLVNAAILAALFAGIAILVGLITRAFGTVAVGMAQYGLVFVLPVLLHQARLQVRHIAAARLMRRV